MGTRKTFGMAGIYIAIFAGLFIGDCAWNGADYALAKLPIRAAVAAVLLAGLWLWNRRKRTVA